MKRLITLLIFNLSFLILNSAFAQTLSPNVLPSCGGYFTGGGNSLSWTMGETFYTTLQNANKILTQGFQQPYIPLTTFYADADSDGYGVSANSQQLIAPSGIYTATVGGDCNDSDASVHPGNIEIYGNGLDDNCNGQIDEGCSASQFELWGMTTRGGSPIHDAGTILKIKPDGSGFANPYTFVDTTGFVGIGSLMQASDGKIYGTTYQGGNYDLGVLFSYDLSTSTYTKLIDFNGIGNGAAPTGDLIQLSDGKLYGTVHQGLGGGAIFSYDPVASIYTVLHDFVLCPECGGYQDGGGPSALMLARDGKLYGTAGGGGASIGSAGIVFRYDPGTNTYMQVVRFGVGASGGVYGPSISTLAQADNGRIYGIASGGTYNLGVIFSFDPYSTPSPPGGCCGPYSLFDVRVDSNFNYGTGITPQGGLMKANNGKLYGATPSGGSTGAGVLFSFDPRTSIYEAFVDSTSGAGSFCTPMQASDGKIYGMFNNGGPYGGGRIFRFDITSNTFGTLRYLGGTDGIKPLYGKLLEVCTPNIVTTHINSPFCTNDSVNVLFAAGGAFGSGNIFTAQLSDTMGSFASPSIIGTSNSLTTINTHISFSTSAGTGYRIRVVSSNPVVTGKDNGSNIIINTCTLQLHMKLFIQGFYSGNGSMSAVVDPINYPNLCDTITVELYNPTAPYNLAYQAKGAIDIYGNGSFVFPLSVLENIYYIVVRHRNSVETWSKTPVLFNNAITNFDFTKL